MVTERQENPSRHPVLHLISGLACVAVGATVLDGHASVAICLLLAVVYVSWTAGRWAGVSITIIGAIVGLHTDEASQHEQAILHTKLGLWIALCLATAVVTSGIERATRPGN